MNEGQLVDVTSSGPCAFSLHLPDFDQQFETSLSLVCSSFGFLPTEVKKFGLVCISMSGCKTELHRSRINIALRRSGVAMERLIVCEDAVAEMQAHGLSRGLLIMVATGVNIYFLGEQEFSVGSWGSEVSDSGGGYALGRSAIRKVLDYIDGREVVSERFALGICNEINVQTPKAIGSWYESLRTTPEWRKQISDLAKIVVELAEEYKDFTALELLQNSSMEVIKSTIAGLRRVPKKELQASFDVLVTGGLIVNSPILLNAVDEAASKFRFDEDNSCSIATRVTIGRRPAVLGTVSIASTGNLDRCIDENQLNEYAKFIEDRLYKNG